MWDLRQTLLYLHCTIIRGKKNALQHTRSWRNSSLKPGKSPISLDAFRPLSLTSCIDKVMEKLISQRLQWWIEENNVLSPYLASFRRRRCTIDSVLDLVTFGDHYRSRENVSVAMFLDTKFTCDTVSHSHILHGFLQLVIRWRTLHRIASFLRERNIFVYANEAEVRSTS